MTPRTEPLRLVSSDDVPASLREALREASTDGPSQVEASSIAAGLGPMLGSGAGGASGAGAAGGGLGAGKIAAVVGAAALVAGGLVWSAKPGPAPEPSPLVAQAPEPGPAAEARQAVLPEVEEEAVAEESEADEPRASAPVASGPPASPPRANPTQAKAKADATAPAAVATPKPTEAALLDAARRSLAKDPERTLVYAEQHRAHYPRGMLAQEREVLVVEALRKLGRAGEAKKHDDEFRSRYPSSMHGRDIPVAGAEGGKK